MKLSGNVPVPSKDHSFVRAEHYRRQLETIAQNATLALFIMDEHQQCTYMNPAAEALTGFTLDEVQGRALHDIIHHTRPDGTHYPLSECPIDQAFPQNMREQGEEVFVHKDGAFYPVAFTASPIRDENRTVGTIIEVRDITEERRDRAERERVARELEVERSRLATVFQKAPAFIAVVRGPDYVFEMANPSYYQLVGHREVLGRPVREALPEVVEQGFIQLLDGVYGTGEPFVGTEIPIRLQRTLDSPREERFVNFVYQPLQEADGSVSGILAHGVDVTELVRSRQQAEELATELEAQAEELQAQAAQLEEMQADLEISNDDLGHANAELRTRSEEAERARTMADDANQAKSAFLANMSHELRTPINAMIGYTDLLELGIAGPLSEAQKAYVERVRASSQHLLGLVNEVLDLAKVESGQIRIEHERVLLRDSIRGALDLILPQAADRGVQVRDEAAGETDIVYWGDEDRVRQILVNLLSNAVKFTPKGGEVRVRCALAEPLGSPAHPTGNGPWVRIEIEDTGIGVAPEQLEHIFEPFYQVEGGYTRESGGTGLGLSISRKLAGLMGGDLRVRSYPGEGSCFTLWLPAAAERGNHSEEGRDEPRILPEVGRLSQVGDVLVRCADSIVRELGDRLREDPTTPGARGLDRAHLEDHTATFLVDTGLALIALDEGGGEPALLRDGSEIQQTISVRHGAQRARLGWPAKALEREFQILRAAIEHTLRRKLPPSLDAETDQALGILRRLLEHAERVSLRGWRRAVDINA